MTEYAVLFPGREDDWDRATTQERAATYDKHREFAEALAARGHKVTGGAELVHTREATVVRRVDGELAITQGPYAETVEQLTGFYTVVSDDLDDLLQICGILAEADGGIEVRACVPSGDPGASS